MNKGFMREGGSHKVICSKCGKEADVPFKPIQGRPVFCRDCYREQKRS